MIQPSIQDYLGAACIASGMPESIHSYPERRHFHCGHGHYLMVDRAGIMRKGASWTHSFLYINSPIYHELLAKGRALLTTAKELSLEELGL